MENYEQFLKSTEVAEMVQKDHKELLRDIRRYKEQLGERKIAPSDFFTESVYEVRGKEYKCYNVTKKGCEFIAHKLTGVKGTEFTAKYINRFHDMEGQIKSIPAAGSRKITFLQEIKAAEHVAKGMSQEQKIAFYQDIYKRHGLKLNIQPEPGLYLEDKEQSYCEAYRRKSIDAIRNIGSERRLCQIYTITKRLMENERN